MSSEIGYNKIEKVDKEIITRKKIFGKTMIALCIVGVLMAFAAFILLIYGVVKDNKWCEIVGIVLNFLNIFTLGVAFVKTMIKFNTYLKH